MSKTLSKTLSKQQAADAGQEFYYSEWHATRLEEFCEKFVRHTMGDFAGKPFIPMDWQRTMFRELFGWLRVEDDTRRYRTAYISTAKKNGKTTTLAALALFLTLEEQGMQTFAVASDIGQASISFREAEMMIANSPELTKMFKINRTQRQINCASRQSWFKVLPGDASSVEGVNGHILFDELHTQKSRLLYDSVRWAGSSRKSPFFICTTTAGYDRNSICYEMYQYAKRVEKDWTYDPTFYSFVCEMPEDGDWKDEENWKKANPSWGTTIKKPDFEASFKECANSLSKENSFKRYRLNCWTQQETRWLDMDAWDKCALPPKESLIGRSCVMGLDLATTFDTSAAVMVFPFTEDDGSVTYDVLARFWIPKLNAEKRERRDRLPYLMWSKDAGTGLSFTEGDICDYDQIRRDINELNDSYKIDGIYVDRWNANQLSVQLSEQDGFNVTGFSQGMAHMSAPSKLLENLVASGKLRHNGNKLLTNHAMNVSIKTDPAGNIRPVKNFKNSVQRVDGIVALIMGLAGASTFQPEEAKPVPQIFVM